jgi:hypothetical protein
MASKCVLSNLDWSWTFKVNFPSAVIQLKQLVTIRNSILSAFRLLTCPTDLKHLPLPPSTAQAAPIAKLASSLERKATAWPISWGWPSLGMGVFGAGFSAPLSLRVWSIGASTAPLHRVSLAFRLLVWELENDHILTATQHWLWSLDFPLP